VGEAGAGLPSLKHRALKQERKENRVIWFLTSRGQIFSPTCKAGGGAGTSKAGWSPGGISAQGAETPVGGVADSKRAFSVLETRPG